MTDLKKNLRHLCQYHESISKICRDIGINRQQFNKYLNGTTIPSSFNLQRIATYFNVDVSDFFLTPDGFKAKSKQSVEVPTQQMPTRMKNLLTRAFPGNYRILQRYAGYYHSYFPSPRKKNVINCSLIQIFEQEGYFFSKTVERFGLNPDGSRFLSKYEGLVSYLNECIFISEFETLTNDAIVETILSPPYRTELQYLSGLTFGTTASQARVPYASRTAWAFLGKSINIKQALLKCGELDPKSLRIDPTVRKLLQLDIDGSINTLV